MGNKTQPVFRFEKNKRPYLLSRGIRRGKKTPWKNRNDLFALKEGRSQNGERGGEPGLNYGKECDLAAKDKSFDRKLKFKAARKLDLARRSGQVVARETACSAWGPNGKGGS